MERGYPSELINVTELAARLGVHPETIRRWERTGVIPPALRRRGIRVYRPEDIKRIEASIFSSPIEEVG